MRTVSFTCLRWKVRTARASLAESSDSSFRGLGKDFTGLPSSGRMVSWKAPDNSSVNVRVTWPLASLYSILALR